MRGACTYRRNKSEEQRDGRERKKDDLTARCKAPLRLTFYISKLENKIRNFILSARECRGEVRPLPDELCETRRVGYVGTGGPRKYSKYL